jgi:hypothetical protein
MIAEDQDTTNVNNNNTRNLTSEYLHYMPSISTTYANPKSLALKAEFDKHISSLATPQDDPVYLELYVKYNGAVLYDNETRASQKHFRASIHCRTLVLLGSNVQTYLPRYIVGQIPGAPRYDG